MRQNDLGGDHEGDRDACSRGFGGDRHRPRAFGLRLQHNPDAQEQAKARWADVQNQYQRRADLIPNLVATVQGYAAQEKNVLTAVVEARAKATQVKVDAVDLTDPAKLKAFQDAQNQLTGALGRLLGGDARTIPISNPTRISWRCSRSSKAPRTASRWRGATTSRRCGPTTPRCATFPTVIWAKTFFSGNKPMAEFTASEGAEKPPQVKF